MSNSILMIHISIVFGNSGYGKTIERVKGSGKTNLKFKRPHVIFIQNSITSHRLYRRAHCDRSQENTLKNRYTALQKP